MRRERAIYVGMIVKAAERLLQAKKIEDGNLGRILGEALCSSVRPCSGMLWIPYFGVSWVGVSVRG